MHQALIAPNAAYWSRFHEALDVRTNVDEKLYTGLINIVMIYCSTSELLMLNYLFQLRSKSSQNSAVDISHGTAVSDIIAYTFEWGQIYNVNHRPTVRNTTVQAVVVIFTQSVSNIRCEHYIYRNAAS